MVLRDLISDVFRTLWSHKLRTFLTMFGIAWGIVSIVLMVAAGEGLRKGQGSRPKPGQRYHDRLPRTHQPAGRRSPRRTRRFTGMMRTSLLCRPKRPIANTRSRNWSRTTSALTATYNNAAFTVTGSHPPFAYIRSLDVGEGRFYNWDDQQEARRVAFLGA